MTPADIQRALLARGFDLGRSGPARDGVDGLIGDRTRQALRAFQRAKGLKVSGEVDYLTGVALMAPLPVPRSTARRGWFSGISSSAQSTRVSVSGRGSSTRASTASGRP